MVGGWGEVEGEDWSMISKLFTCWSRNQKSPILYLLNGDFFIHFFSFSFTLKYILGNGQSGLFYIVH